MIVPDLASGSQRDLTYWIGLAEEGLGNMFIGQFCNNQYHSEIADNDSGISDLFSSFTTVESSQTTSRHKDSEDPLFLRYYPCMYLWRHSGEIYNGTFMNGVQHGYGQLTNISDGSRVTSYLTRGCRNGLGTFERLTDFYTGLYKNDKSEGIGIYQLNRRVPLLLSGMDSNHNMAPSTSDDSALIEARFNSYNQRYVGEWHDGCYDGWGIHHGADAKAIFIGHFKGDKRIGKNLL